MPYEVEFHWGGHGPHFVHRVIILTDMSEYALQKRYDNMSYDRVTVRAMTDSELEQAASAGAVIVELENEEVHRYEAAG